MLRRLRALVLRQGCPERRSRALLADVSPLLRRPPPAQPTYVIALIFAFFLFVSLAFELLLRLLESW